MDRSKIIQVDEKVPFGKWIPLSIQHTFAMFSASVLVPWLLGINPAVVLLMNGIGTLIFIFITKGKAPAYLGSSFAFLSPTFLILANPNNGGLILSDTYTQINPKFVAVFIITLAVAVFGQVLFRGFAAAIAILISIIVGYVAALCMGLVDFSAVREAAWVAMPNFSFPKFDVSAILIIIPASLVVISEHIGHQVVTSEIVGRDLLKDPGLHRSLLSDGISTTLSGLCGSVPTTTYGENIGVMAVTKVYSVWVIGGAAIFSMILGFIGKASALIQTIPSPVMGGVSFLLYGMIAASGLRLLVDKKVNFAKPRNLALTSVIFVTGLSGAFIKVGEVQLTGMCLATIVGMALGIIFFIIDKAGIANDAE